jgi:hypothetical protein
LIEEPEAVKMEKPKTTANREAVGCTIDSGA